MSMSRMLSEPPCFTHGTFGMNGEAVGTFTMSKRKSGKQKRVKKKSAVRKVYRLRKKARDKATEQN